MKYSEYKMVDVPWIKSIPDSWEMVPNKALFKKRQVKVGDEYKKFQLLSLTTKGVREKSIEDSRGKVPTSYNGYQEVRANDMVFCLFDLDVSAVFSGLSSYDGMITSAYDVAECNERYIRQKYADYWFQFVFSNRFYKMYSKNVRYTISFDAFGAIKTPVPPIDEQEIICKYLDWQISKVNKLIEIKKKQVALLREQQEIRISQIVKSGVGNCKLKESGIEYIGEIPAHWKVLLNGRVFKEKGRKFDGEPLVLSLSQKDGLIPYKNMTERSLHTASYDNWKLVYPNDLVLNRFKAHLGVFFASDYEGIVTFHYGVFEPKMKVNAKYYEALYHTAEYKNKYAGQSNGMTIGLQNLSNKNFYSVYTVYPPYEEQCEIVNAIREIEKNTKEAIGVITEYIEQLHEIKHQIISEVVTGQLDVRSINIPDFEYVQEEDDYDEEDIIDDDSLDEEV